jgi:hypothetical protein
VPKIICRPRLSSSRSNAARFMECLLDDIESDDRTPQPR